MTGIQFQEAFEREINQFDDVLNKPTSTETEWWLNQGLEKFYKTRYSGINFKQFGFEQNQKRIDDLRTLVSKTTLSPTSTDNKTYSVTLPSDYIMLLGDTAGIQPNGDNDCWEKDSRGQYVIKYTDTLESTIETIDRDKQNSLSEYRLKYCFARPLKLIQGENIILYTDGQYKVSEYILTYLKRPIKINIHKNPFSEYTSMPQHTHSEIVKLAAQMYIENKGNQRYNSYSNEVNTME